MNVTLEHVRFRWHGKPVLTIDSLHLPAGHTTAILGPNGAGKSTLLRIISGLACPFQGTVRIGKHLVKPPRPAAEHVAFAFQKPVFVSGTVRENIDLGLRLRGLSAANRRTRVAEVAQDCEIIHLLERSTHHLSQGEAQRVNLARALALRAPVTLLDEPLSGFDPGIRSRLLDDLPRLFAAWATTVLVVTHDREEALWLADHLVIMIGGHVLASGPARTLVVEPPDPETAKLLGYTIVSIEGAPAGIPPGALRFGKGEPPLEMVVERVVDLGNRREVAGSIGETKARATWLDGDPLPERGQSIAVNAERIARFR